MSELSSKKYDGLYFKGRHKTPTNEMLLNTSLSSHTRLGEQEPNEKKVFSIHHSSRFHPWVLLVHSGQMLFKNVKSFNFEAKKTLEASLHANDRLGDKGRVWWGGATDIAFLGKYSRKAHD